MSEHQGRSAFWSANQPGFKFTDADPGSARFFDEVTRHRYELEPHILEVGPFESWRGLRVLEVGCGVGTDGYEIARRGARYVGLDESPVAIDLARRRFELGHLSADLVRGSATELPFADGSFDRVWSHGVIHHFPATDRAVREMHRVLAPGGEAWVMVYHKASLNYHLTIMVVRRGLAALLLIPGMDRRIAAITGEDIAVVRGHRELLRRHGRRYLTDAGLFLSNNTDGPNNPLSKVYTRREARAMFRAAGFSSVTTRVRYLNLRAYPGGELLARTAVARALGRVAGWHLYVRAVKD